MFYIPPSVASQDLDVAESGYFGGEFGVYISPVAALKQGQIDLSAAGTGTYTDNLATSIAAATDLQLVALTPILSAAALAITLAGLDNTSTPVAMNGVATFTPPTRAVNQTFNFQRGIATDLIPAVGGKKFTSITGLGTGTPIVNGGPNQSFGLYQLPQQSDYSFIVATKDVDFNTRSRMAKGIDAGMESDFWIKRGKTQPGELTIGSKLQSFVEGMTRFDGMKCTLMLVGLKDGYVTGDRLVFTEYVQTIKPRLPEGDNEAEIPSTGKFREVLFFFAP